MTATFRTSIHCGPSELLTPNQPVTAADGASDIDPTAERAVLQTLLLLLSYPELSEEVIRARLAVLDRRLGRLRQLEGTPAGRGDSQC